MKLMSSKILNDLHNLINTNLEAQSGYKTAAEKVNNKNLKEIFIIYIQRKSEYVDELKRLSKELFGEKEEKDNFPFEKFTIQMPQTDANSVLLKCEDLEEKSLKNYESILNDEIPSNIKETLLRHSNGIKEARIHMKSLEGKF